MGCNCGDNEYNITVNNNGNCEPTTPIYNITLANVGVNGYSPIVRFINETVESFNIAVDNVTGTETSPAVPKLSYVADQINDVNNTIAGLGSTYLARDGNNATLPFSIGNLTLYSNSTTISGSVNASGYIATGEIRPRNSSGIIIGYDSYDAPINIVTANKAYYNNNEIATLSDIPTVGNGTIAIMMNGAIKGSFKVNQSYNTILDLGSTSNYTAGNGINITNDVISVDENDLSFLKNDGSNADVNFTVNGIKLSANTISSNVSTGGTGLLLNQTTSGNYIDIGAGTTGTHFYTNGFFFSSDTSNQIPDITMSSTGDIKIYPTLGAKLYYGDSKTAANEVATKGNLPTNFVGCDSITGGTSGLVPAPSAGDEDKFLKADGTWDTVGGGGGGTSYIAGTGININNDTISTSSTVVTTDTAQTITGGKVFNNNIDITYGNHIRSINNGTPTIILLNNYQGISLGNTSSVLSFVGVDNRPRYTKNMVDYSDLAFVSDIPTVNNATITFTQGGTTKGTITLNQSGDATIALDAGGAGSGGTEIYEDSQASEYLPSVIVGDGLTLDYSVIYTDWTNPQMNSASQDGYVVTSNYNSSESGADNWKAFDKDTTTSENCWWSGAYPNTPVWIQLEVPTAVIPTSCTIYNEVATPANFKDAVLQGSNDGINYDDLYTITNSPNTAGYSQTYNITTNTAYKYLRLSCTSYWDVGVSLQEIIWEGKIPSGLTNTPSLKVELAINDTTASNSTVYSSQKTQDLIDALVARITALENNIDGGNA